VASIARLQNNPEQEALIDALLEGATNRDIRERIHHLKGSGRDSGIVKPKQVYETSQKAIVIIQSMNSTLEPQRRIRALEEALNKAQDEPHTASRS